MGRISSKICWGILFFVLVYLFDFCPPAEYKHHEAKDHSSFTIHKVCRDRTRLDGVISSLFVAQGLGVSLPRLCSEGWALPWPRRLRCPLASGWAWTMRGTNRSEDWRREKQGSFFSSSQHEGLWFWLHLPKTIVHIWQSHPPLSTV